MTSDAATPEVTTIAAPDWEQAQRFLPTIRRLAENQDRTRADAKAAAAELGCAVSHVYALVRRYAIDPRLTSLIPRRRGPRNGSSRLPNALSALVDEAIEKMYLTRQKPRLADLVEDVQRRCHALGMRAPSRNAIVRRVRTRPEVERVGRRDGNRVARDRFAPVVGRLEAARPLAIVQIDHTLVDVIVVDSATREPIQRPWLTLAIDVYSRCVAGFYLSLEAPSAASVALCLSHVVLPKELWLSRQRVAGTYPVRGIPERLHLDNAKEFRSEALRRGCGQYGIEIDYRPVRTPHYGGHIERLIGTMMGKVHLLPGTTGSDIASRGDIDPERTAAMTLEEVERWLAHAVVGVYHQQVHRMLGTTPLAAWERGVQEVGAARLRLDMADARRFLLDFLPIERRKIRRDGVHLHGIGYWSDVLHTWVGDPEQMIVRYDPRDLSRIYLLAPGGMYYDLTYRDIRRPAISLWEHRLALKRLREAGREEVDEELLFRTIETMRSITANAVLSSKVARRQNERRRHLGAPLRTTPEESLNHVEFATSESSANSQQPHERMFPVEEW